jgi:hypothetical protein
MIEKVKISLNKLQVETCILKRVPQRIRRKWRAHYWEMEEKRSLLHSDRRFSSTSSCIYTLKKIKLLYVIISVPNSHQEIGHSRSPLKKINKEHSELKTMDQMDLIHIYRIFHLRATEYKFFFFNYSFLHMCIHCLGHFSLLLHPSVQGSFCSAFITNFVEEKTQA